MASGKAWMGGCLGIGFATLVLVALAIYCAFPHPTHDQAKLQPFAAEARSLMATYPVGPSQRSVRVPKGKWPPAIAAMKPYMVSVSHGLVHVRTEPGFDGGWGYGYAPDKQNLSMLVECWSALGHDVYWHGPC